MTGISRSPPGSGSYSGIVMSLHAFRHFLTAKFYLSVTHIYSTISSRHYFPLWEVRQLLWSVVPYHVPPWLLIGVAYSCSDSRSVAFSIFHGLLPWKLSFLFRIFEDFFRQKTNKSASSSDFQFTVVFWEVDLWNSLTSSITSPVLIEYFMGRALIVPGLRNTPTGRW